MDWVRFYGLLAIMFVVGGAVRIFNGDLNIGLGLALLGLIAYLATVNCGEDGLLSILT